MQSHFHKVPLGYRRFQYCLGISKPNQVWQLEHGNLRFHSLPKTLGSSRHSYEGAEVGRTMYPQTAHKVSNSLTGVVECSGQSVLYEISDSGSVGLITSNSELAQGN